MNPLISFTNTFVILHTDFPKMKLIGILFMGDLGILSTYPNPAQQTLVMDLCNHNQA